MREAARDGRAGFQAVAAEEDVRIDGRTEHGDGLRAVDWRGGFEDSEFLANLGGSLVVAAGDDLRLGDETQEIFGDGGAGKFERRGGGVEDRGERGKLRRGERLGDGAAEGVGDVVHRRERFFPEGGQDVGIVEAGLAGRGVEEGGGAGGEVGPREMQELRPEAKIIFPACETFGDEKATVIFGSVAAKDFEASLAILADIAARFFFVTLHSPRAVPAEVLAAGAPRGPEGTAFSSLAEAVRAAESFPERQLICGSLFLCGEALSLLRGGSFEPSAQ